MKAPLLLGVALLLVVPSAVADLQHLLGDPPVHVPTVLTCGTALKDVCRQVCDLWNLIPNGVVQTIIDCLP